MIYLVGAILLIQLINLFLNNRAVRKVDEMNKTVMERQKQAIEDHQKKDIEWKAIQKAELQELRELVKGSKYIEGLINGIQEANK
jgi:hypothetical protein